MAQGPALGYLNLEDKQYLHEFLSFCYGKMRSLYLHIEVHDFSLSCVHIGRARLLVTQTIK
jgi:hypothetical protein